MLGIGDDADALDRQLEIEELAAMELELGAGSATDSVAAARRVDIPERQDVRRAGSQPEVLAC